MNSKVIELVACMRRKEISGKMFLQFLIILLLLILVSACGNRISETIIGAWEATDGSQYIEFEEGGKLRLSQGHLEDGGWLLFEADDKYEFVDKDTIRLTTTNFFGVTSTLTLDVSISDNLLTLEDINTDETRQFERFD